MLVVSHASGTTAAKTPPAARSNVVLITLDTTRADRMGFLGAQGGLTPNLDALASQGVVFSRAYSHVPLTPPSHATILTGTYPQFNHLTFMGEPLAKDLPYLPDLLHRRGYRTAAFVGSMILDPKNVTAFGFERGFDKYDAGFHKRRRGEDRYQSVERRAGDVVNRAIAWLGKRPPGPFFLWVHVYDPHGPYDPPEPFKSRFRDPYDGEIAYTDASMGKLFEALRVQGLYDNTIIVATADHGEAFGEHGERHHGVFLYDETIHVPLLIKPPRNRLRGARVASRARLVDIAPTVLQLLGMPVPVAVQGKSLLGMMNSDTGPEAVEDRPAYSESVYAHRAFGWAVLRTWRARKYLYVQAPERELYDQAADAPAAHNLVDTSKAVADTLADQLAEFRQKTSSASAGKSSLTPEQAENLRALGYLPSSGAAGEADKEAAIDPKEKIEIANLLTQALYDAQEERYQDAIPKLQQVLKQEPNTTMAYLELGRAFAHLKNYQEALPLLRTAVEKLPEDNLARYEFGRALAETGDWSEARLQFEASVARAPKSADSHFHLAFVYQRLERIPEAMKEYQTALRLDPDHFRANLFYGRLLGIQKKPAAALPYLKKAVKLQPQTAEAHQFLANVYTLLGQEANARREREEVERLRNSSTP